jgi:hypothetical protein
MSDQPSNNPATNAQALSLPDPVLVALSVSGIDPARFCAVIDAFGPLPNDGQVELVNRLIEARDGYLSHRMWKCDKAMPQGARRERLKEIGTTAGRLRRLLHRDGALPKPWNLHPAITLALPELCRTGSQHRPNQIWDPPQGLSLLEAMLTDLVEVGAQADAIFEAPFPKTHGGERREGHEPATGLVYRLIEVYEDLRARFPDSGPRSAFGKPLLQFVRAGLAFAVSTRTIYVDEKYLQSPEAAYVEAKLPTRLTDAAIKRIFERHRPS